MSENVVYGNDQDVYNAICRLEEYEDTGLTPDEIRELAEARKEGRLVELPCNVGDIVLTNLAVNRDYYRANRPYACTVVFVKLILAEDFVGGYINVEYSGGQMWQFNFSDFGKTVFHTCEEAEAALKEANSNGD